MMVKTIPVAFYTNVRKIEPIAGDCIRVYCAVERNGVWEDRVILELPAVQMIKNCKFVLEAVREFYGDEIAPPGIYEILH